MLHTLSSGHNFRSGKEKKTVNGAETEIDERPHYFALRLKKSAIDFYLTFLEGTRKSYHETVKAFRQHYNEKPIILRWRLSRRVQQPSEKLTDFLSDLQTLALKAYPQESNEVGKHLILRGFLESIENSQVRLDMRKNLSDAYKTLDNALDRALRIEAVTRIEEEDNEPRVSSSSRTRTLTLDNPCNKTKEATKEVLGKWSAECEALRYNLKAAAARNAEQEPTIEVLKQELANLKVKTAKMGKAIEKK